MLKPIPRDQYTVFFDLIAAEPDGLSLADLTRRVSPSPHPRLLGECLQALVTEGRLECVRNKAGHTVRYKAVTVASASAVSSSDISTKQPANSTSDATVVAPVSPASADPVAPPPSSADAPAMCPSSAPTTPTAEPMPGASGEAQSDAAASASSVAAPVIAPVSTSATPSPAPAQPSASDPSAEPCVVVAAPGVEPPASPLPNPAREQAQPPLIVPSAQEQIPPAQPHPASAQQASAVERDVDESVTMREPPQPTAHDPIAPPEHGPAQPSADDTHAAEAEPARDPVCEPSQTANEIGRASGAPDRRSQALLGVLSIAAAIVAVVLWRGDFGDRDGVLPPTSADGTAGGSPPGSGNVPPAQPPQQPSAQSTAPSGTPSDSSWSAGRWPAKHTEHGSDGAGLPRGRRDSPGSGVPRDNGPGRQRPPNAQPPSTGSASDSPAAHPTAPTPAPPTRTGGAPAGAPASFPRLPSTPGIYVWREDRWEFLPQNNAHRVTAAAARSPDFMARVDRWRAAAAGARIPDAEELVGAVILDGFEPVPIVRGTDLLFVIVPGRAASPLASTVSPPAAAFDLIPLGELSDGSRYTVPASAPHAAPQPLPLAVLPGPASATLLRFPGQLAPGGYALRGAPGVYEVLVR